MSGKKDDAVLQLAIGLACIISATTYAEPRVQLKLPWDLELLDRTERQHHTGPGMAMRW
ncbi:MAG: hypothetical protein ACR2NX_04305 [Chthoniobacterales bacterium]